MKKYIWQTVYDFTEEVLEVSDEEISDPDGIYCNPVKLATVTNISHIAFLDPALKVRNDNLKTPLGLHSREKYDLVKLLEWFTIFKIFQNAAAASFLDESFESYPRATPWYLFASEQEQLPCLVAEVAGKAKREAFRAQELISPDKEVRENYDSLIVNSCIEEPLLLLLAWMKEHKEYEKVLLVYESIALKGIENKITDFLINHYKLATKKQVECGGLLFYWYSANAGHADAFGRGFSYEDPLSF